MVDLVVSCIILQVLGEVSCRVYGLECLGFIFLMREDDGGMERHTFVGETSQLILNLQD